MYVVCSYKERYAEKKDRLTFGEAGRKKSAAKFSSRTPKTVTKFNFFSRKVGKFSLIFYEYKYRMVSARNAEAVHGPRFEFPIQAEFIVKRWNWIPNCTFFYGQKIPTSTSTWLLYVLVQCLLIRIIKDDVDN